MPNDIPKVALDAAIDAARFEFDGDELPCGPVEEAAAIAAAKVAYAAGYQAAISRVAELLSKREGRARESAANWKGEPLEHHWLVRADDVAVARREVLDVMKEAAIHD